MNKSLIETHSAAKPVRRSTTETAAWCAEGTPSDLPRWTTRFMNGTESTSTRPSPDTEILERHNDAMHHRTAILRGAANMDAAAFTERTLSMYLELLHGIERDRIFRIWNFIPRIGYLDSAGLDRYMRFNTARFQAFSANASGTIAYPPASGVGHAGEDLIVHLLAADAQVKPIENPRQVPPNEYSTTWGPMPPVFARGAIVDGLPGSSLFIASGTASVRGEDTVFPGDLDNQLHETSKNLATLSSQAAEVGAQAMEPHLDSMLVYVSSPLHLESVQQYVEKKTCGASTDIEYRIGPLCRDSLLVEIEGVRFIDRTETRA